MKNQEVPNPDLSLELQDLTATLGGRWVREDTAILVVHGIGNQNPLETLDGFARGLVETYQKAGYNLALEHHLARKTASDSNTPWFDNFLRIRQQDGSETSLDIYEYYWAHETEGQATLRDLNTWLNNVTKGAKSFYKNNVVFATNHHDNSIFIKNGQFRPVMYWFCISFVPQLFLLLNWLGQGLYKILAAIPLIGPLFSLLVEGRVNNTVGKLANVLNDITIYNTTDAKSRFFRIRNCILDGAVKALRYLLEAQPQPGSDNLTFRYNRVLLAGHSLGSQIAFDAINRLNHLVNQGEILGYDTKGQCTPNTTGARLPVTERLIGLVTFGSPLDKIAFFFREQVPHTEYLRSQIINHFHGFKQRRWVNIQENEAEQLPVVKPCEERLFEQLTWRNYWDDHDYVSGSLDYYKDVINVKCCFVSKWHSFTHSRYWDCKPMYADIIHNFLVSDKIIPRTETAPAAKNS